VALKGAATGDGELGRSYASLLGENLGEPGFRELILRTADLGPRRAARLRAAARADERGRAGPRGPRRPAGARAGRAVLRRAGTGLLLPVALPLRRVTFPKGAVHAGETHRLTDAALVPGCGIAEAIDAAPSRWSW
jgi:hypothetical protein